MCMPAAVCVCVQSFIFPYLRKQYSEHVNIVCADVGAAVFCAHIKKLHLVALMTPNHAIEVPGMLPTLSLLLDY